MANELAEKIEEYREARNKATSWLLSLKNIDGSIGPVTEGCFYYRIPWTLSVVGETGSAQKFTYWFRKNMVAPSGELWGKYPLGNYQSHYTYLLGNVICGTHLMGEYDISQSCKNALMRFFDMVSGGFSNALPSYAASNLIETWISAQAGLACLIVGETGIAERVGDFLQLTLDMQPDFPNKLYFVYDQSSQQLVNSISGEESSIFIDSNKGRQYFFAPGLIAGFLVRLFQQTRKINYLELAEKYQGFVQNCSDKQFNGIEVCKTAWGASLLYQVTRDHRYLDWAIKVGDYFARTINEDGYWRDDRFNSSTLGQDIALTAQNILWIDSAKCACATAASE